MKAKVLAQVLECDELADINWYMDNNELYHIQIDELAARGIKRVDAKEFVECIKSSPYYVLYETTLDSIKSEFLYKSYTHGVYHNERTSLYAFYLATQLGLNERDVLLSLYAAMYHDIGRVDDFLDDAHGERSANKLNLLDLPISAEEMKMLKVIITGHSLSDELFDYIVNEYKVEDYNRTKILYSIIKDADGLDRTRLSHPYVKLNYLRNEIARELVPLSYEIFEFYYRKTKN